MAELCAWIWTYDVVHQTWLAKLANVRERPRGNCHPWLLLHCLEIVGCRRYLLQWRRRRRRWWWRAR